MHQEMDVTVKHVGEQLVAGIRRDFGADESALDGVLALMERIGEHAIGAPMYMEHGYDKTRGFDIEVCVPVAAPIEQPPIRSRVLPAEAMLSVMHRGPYSSRNGLPGMGDTWHALWGFIIDKKLSPEDPNANPTRIIVHKGRNAAVDAFEVEIQIPYHFPVWVERFREGLLETQDAQQADRIMSGVGGLGDGFDHEAVRTWIRGAMKRLDEAVPDPVVRARCLRRCAHTPSPASVARLRAAFREAGTLDRFLGILPSLQAERYWREPGRPKSVLFTEKSPFEITAELHEKATDPVDRRYFYCHCALVKEAIRTGERISTTFCNCGGGFYVKMWEAITEKPVRVEVLETVLGGADRCRFAIHLTETAGLDTVSCVKGCSAVQSS